MKIVFFEPLHKFWEFFRGVTASPAFVYLTAVAEKEFDVKVFDACVEPEKPWDAAVLYLRKEKPDVVAITGSITCFWNDTLNAAKLVRKILPDAKIITGGYIASVLWEEALKTGLFDFIVIGEGEITMMELLRALNQKKSDFEKIKGLAFLKDGKPIKTAPRPLIKDLDTLPMQGWHHFPMDRYGLEPFGGKVGFAVSFSRGCNNRCAYCADTMMWGHCWRGHGAEYMVEALEILSKKYGKRVFYIGDPDFLYDPERIEKFISLMVKRKVDVKMWIQTTCANIIKYKHMLKGLNEAGVYQIMLGIETISPEVLKNFRKPQNFELIDKAVKIVQKENKFILMGMLMWGAPWDTKESLKETLNYLVKNCDIVGPNCSTPFPGTPYYEKCKEMGVIEVWDLSLYDWMNIVTRTADMSAKEADKYYKNLVGKTLLLNKKMVGNYFFSNKPLYRTYMNQFVKMGWSLFTHKPWRQKNYQDFNKNFNLDKYT